MHVLACDIGAHAEDVSASRAEKPFKSHQLALLNSPPHAAMVATPATSFMDLPPELRNQIYEYYTADAIDPTISISSLGFLSHREFLPPPLARASSQVRAEFMGYWSSATHDLQKTKHLKARVVNFDFKFLENYFDYVGAVVERETLFETVSITLIFTKNWPGLQRRVKGGRLRSWLLWGEEPGKPIANGTPRYTAKCIEVALSEEDARLMRSDWLAGDEDAKRIRAAVSADSSWARPTAK